MLSGALSDLDKSWLGEKLINWKSDISPLFSDYFYLQISSYTKHLGMFLSISIKLYWNKESLECILELIFSGESKRNLN